MQSFPSKISILTRRGGAAMVVIALLAVLVIAGLVTYLVFKPESRGADRPASAFVPEDASVVVSLNLDSILKKSDLPGLLKENPEMMMMVQMMGGGSLQADLSEKGFRSGEPILVFTIADKGGVIIGAVAPLSDRAQFEKTLEELKKSPVLSMAMNGNEDDYEITERDGTRGMFSKSMEDIAFVYTHQAMLFLHQSDSAIDLNAMAIDLLKNGGGLTDVNEAFRDFGTANYDLGLWYNGEKASGQILDELPGEMLPPDLEELLKNTVSLGLRFENGKAVLEGTAYHNGEQQLPTHSVSDHLIDAVPGDALFAVVAGLDVQAMMKVAKQMLSEVPELPEEVDEQLGAANTFLENMLGMNGEELTEKLSGDFMLSVGNIELPESKEVPPPKLFGLEKYIPSLNLPAIELPKVELVAGLTTREPGSLQESIDHMESAISGLGIEVVAKDKTVFLASTKHAEEIQKSGKATTPLSAGHRALLAGNHVAGYINYTRLEELAEKLPMLKDSTQGMESFDILAFAAKSDAKKHQLTVSLHFKEREHNSLRQLLKAALESSNRGGADFGEPGDITEPDFDPDGPIVIEDIPDSPESERESPAIPDSPKNEEENRQ